MPDLPVKTAIPALAETLEAGHAVLTAPPGSGKTTLVPLALLNAPWLAGRKILMLEPRRPAARMAARRLAQLAGEQPGGLVGYQVRLERRIGPHTRIEVVTEGILTRRLQSDPELQDVGLLIFDEFHERNLQADLGLALSLDVCNGLREDLRLLVMSATLDPRPLCELLPARHVAAEGRQFPVEVRYLPPHDRRDALLALPGLARQALREADGDVLVFLPGRGEIEQLGRELEADCARQGIVLCKLYGDLPAGEQDRILVAAPGGPRRLILSTDLAESSVTIDGVGCVVDSGLARKPLFDPNSGMTRLQREPISQASADQRCGRAGRLGPGSCYRAWTEARHARFLPGTPPEIARSDLSGLVLELALWGVRQPEELGWLDRPPAAHWGQAVELLQSLGALDNEGGLSGAGRRMAQLGQEPRLARLLSAARNRSEAQLAADLAVLLSERDLLDRREAGVDLELRLEQLQRLRENASLHAGVDRRRARHLLQLSESLQQRASSRDDHPTGCRDHGALLSLAFPDRIARQRSKGSGRFLLANGRGAILDQADPLARHEWIVVADLDAGQREGRIWSALAVSPQGLEEALGERLEERRECYWDGQRDAPVARQVRRLGALVLSEQRVAATGDEMRGLLFEQLRARWPDGLRWDDPARQLQARIQHMRGLYPDREWPDVSDDHLKSDLAGWLNPWLNDRYGWSALGSLDLSQCLGGLLDWQQQQQLDRCLPGHYTSPAGSRRRIDYLAGGSPRVAVPLAEVFGEQASPTLAEGRLPLVLELLNPAGRPIQVTSDLANFWKGAYVDVRKELRGRYPKHDWPEDPGNARARRGTGRPKR